MKGLELYIGGMRADTGDDSLVVMNYSFEDLRSPAAVKNSYSNTVKLKGTANNNRIFGEYFRPDRVNKYSSGGTGAGFNPSVRTPFAIYAPTGEVLESGYVKLDSVTRNGADVEYSVTLYGGLGSFFYTLMYGDDGDKLTLADLNYMGTSNPDGEFDFVISKDTVESAWTALQSGTGSAMWQAINFAPCYNGIPDSGFSPDKAVVRPGDVGLAESATSDGKEYTPGAGGFCMVNLSAEHDEWAVKDLRSYMQRPVLSMRKFMEAVCDPSNNGGHTVDISDIDGGRLPELDTWVTLPMLNSLETVEYGTPDIRLTGSSQVGDHLAIFQNYGDSIPFGTELSAKFNIVPYFYNPGATGKDINMFIANPANNSSILSVIFLQAVAYDRNGTPTGASTVHCIAPEVYGRKPEAIWTSPEWMAELTGYEPEWTQLETVYETLFDSMGFTESTDRPGWLKYGNALNPSLSLSFELECSYVDNIKIMISCATILGTGTTLIRGSAELTNTVAFTVYESYDGAEPVGHVSTAGSAELSGAASFEAGDTPSGARSGSRITKNDLLGGMGTPADFLLSFCKVFGLVFLFDDMEKKVTILQRRTFFKDTVTDLSGRVDLSQAVEIKPFAFTSKWYDFAPEGSGGAFEEEYSERHGRAYGMQRVNTGYEFDGENVEVLDGIAFKGAASVLEFGKYWNIISSESTSIPSVFIDTGNTYSLYDSGDNSEDFTVPCPPYGAAVQYYNTANKGYDMQGAAKPQFHDKDGKPCDGQGVLLYLSRFARYDSFKLSDDNGAMAVLNGNEACWDLTPGSGLTIPVFSTYSVMNIVGGGWQVAASLDLGIPAEIGIPGLSYPSGVTIYDRYWKDYISDRYSVDNKVARCKVDLRGLDVGQELLRGFWWFEDSLWVLNSISDYALGTEEPAQCEFVQVRDMAAYAGEVTYIEFSPPVLEFEAVDGAKTVTLNCSGGSWTIQ